MRHYLLPTTEEVRYNSIILIKLDGQHIDSKSVESSRELKQKTPTLSALMACSLKCDTLRQAREHFGIADLCRFGEQRHESESCGAPGRLSWLVTASQTNGFLLKSSCYNGMLAE